MRSTASRYAPATVLCVAFGVLLAGCNERAAVLPREEPVTRSSIDSLRQQISSMQGQVFLLKRYAAPNYSSIQLDPSSTAYQRLDTASGFFLVACEGVKPYLDGYVVTLHIGNPTSATYTGFTLHAQWGGVFATPSDTMTQQRDIAFPNTLRPAAWNRVEVILTPATAEQMKSVFLSMETSQISLYKP